MINKDAGDNGKINLAKIHLAHSEKRVEMQDLMRWKHLDPTNMSSNCNSLQEDPILKEAVRYLSYVFKNEVYASAALGTA